MRLFCFPYAGVGPSAFRGWAEGVASHLEACFVHLPGREGRLRERPYTSMSELIPPLVDALTSLLDRPTVIYGHSVGAKIALETCYELRRRAAGCVAHLFVGACPSPHLDWEHAHMHALEDGEFLAEIQSRYGGVPSEIMRDPEIRSLLLPAMRADVTLLETHRHHPEAPLNCPITAFGGDRDRMVTPESIDGWRSMTSGRFRMRMLDGDHFFAQSAKAELLQAISEESNSLDSSRELE
jgi:medium-chain acyl-[acyl-carrier-protein] hydrolase